MNNQKRYKSKLPYLLLLVSLFGTLWPSFYNSVQPELWGFPFFYWYQFLWIPLSAIITGAVYLATE